MTGLRWRINRLRTMSPGELVHRTRRVIAQRWEQARIGSGWSPGEGCRLRLARSLFAETDLALVRGCWQRQFELETDSLEALMEGRLPMFGKTFDIGRNPDWHRDPKTGRRAPLTYGMSIDYRNPSVVGDIKVLWELGRHQHLVPLAVAYVISGDDRYRVAVRQQIDSWIVDNPYGRGVHWCSALEVALRGIAWSMVHSLLSLRDGEGLLGATRDRDALIRALYQHAYFISRNLSRYSSANNHLIGELVGLLCLASVFDFGDVSVEWRSTARRELEREIDLQVWPDGVAREQAVQYQLELLDYFIFACCVIERTGDRLPEQALQRIRSMVRFLRELTPSGGVLPQIGDSDEGTVNRFSLAAAPTEDDIIDSVDYLLGGTRRSPRSERAFWYRHIAPLMSRTSETEKAASERAPHVSTFPDGGYVVLRHGHLHLVFDAGPLGYLSIAAHGHADALACCASWRGQWWLVDPGTYAYHGDWPFRQYFRGTSAHNTAVVAGRDQSIQGGPFMWLSHATATLLGSGQSAEGCWAEGMHEGYKDLGVLHRRRIETHPSGFSTIDTFSIDTSRPCPVELNFHFHPRVELMLRGESCIATTRDGEEVLRISLDPAWKWASFRGSVDPIAGWYSSGLGRKEPSWTLRGTAALKGEVTTSTIFRFEKAEASKYR